MDWKTKSRHGIQSLFACCSVPLELPLILSRKHCPGEPVTDQEIHQSTNWWKQLRYTALMNNSFGASLRFHPHSLCQLYHSSCFLHRYILRHCLPISGCHWGECGWSPGLLPLIVPWTCFRPPWPGQWGWACLVRLRCRQWWRSSQVLWKLLPLPL